MKQVGIRIAKTSRLKVSYLSTKTDFKPTNRSHVSDFKISFAYSTRSYSVFQKTVNLEDYFNQPHDPIVDIDVFAQQDEFTLLRALVNNQLTTKFDDSMANLRQKREHQRLLNNATSDSTVNLDFALSLKSTKHNRSRIHKRDFLQKAQEYISTPTRTPEKKEIINFISIHTSNSPTASQLYEILKVMAEFSNQYTLPVLFKAYHHIFNDTKSWPTLTPLKRDFLYETLLIRALHIFPKTEYVVEDGSIFEALGSNQLDDLSEIVGQTEGSKAKDLYLRLVSKSGSFKEADRLITESINEGVMISDESVDTFFTSLGNYLEINRSVSSLTRLEYNACVKSAIKKYKYCLKSQNITPAIAEFVLEHTSYLEEFYRLLNAIEQSRYRDNILSKCQPIIIQTAVRCSLPTSSWIQLESESGNLKKTNEHEETQLVVDYDAPAIRKVDIYAKSMATMFGILSRFGKSSAGITVEALDQCLVISARLGNPSGIYKALTIRLQGINPPTLSSKTLVKVFDSFPLNHKGLNKEKVASPCLWVVNDAIIADSARDEIILLHLRNHFDPLKNTKLYHRYLSALGRCHRIDLLLHEWKTVISLLVTDNEHLENPHFQDIFMFLLAAFKTANSPENGLVVLDSLLQASTVSESNHGFALNVLVKVISHELLPLSTTLNHITRWLINNNSAAFWSDTDVLRLFGEISMSAPDVTVMPSENQQQKGETPSIIGRLLSELVIQVRCGQDVELALKHLEHTFGQ